jgi:hypothetical protein
MDLFGGQYYPNGINRERSKSIDSLWLQIIPRKLVMTDLKSRINNIADNTTKEDPMSFLMPMSYMSTVQHEWQELSTVSSALRDLQSKYGTAAKQATGAVGKGGFTVGDKADNPILYSNTTRRNIQVQLLFSVYSSTYDDVFLPCQRLIEQSCPDNVPGQNTQFTYPYVFSLQTYTGDNQPTDIISIKSVGIQSIQPTYDGPWIDGYPSKAQLDITFIDLNPLYRSLLLNETNKKITVRSKR